MAKYSRRKWMAVNLFYIQGKEPHSIPTAVEYNRDHISFLDLLILKKKKSMRILYFLDIKKKNSVHLKST